MMKSRTLDIMWTLFVLAVIVFARLLSYAPDTVSLAGRALPGLCFFHNVTGVNCPTCGMTRSISALMHGDFVSSFLMHPLGAVTLLLMCLSVPLAILFYFRGTKPLFERRLFLAGAQVLAISCCILWAFRLFI